MEADSLITIPHYASGTASKFYDDDGFFCDGHWIHPSPLPIWCLTEFGRYDQYSRRPNYKKISIKENDLFISSDQLLKLTKNNEYINPTCICPPDSPKKLLILVAMYLAYWKKELEDIGDNNIDSILIRQSINKKIDDNLIIEFKKNYFDQGFSSRSLLRGCVTILRPDELLNSQEKNAHKGISKTTSPTQSSILNALLRVADEFRISESNPEQAPEKNTLVEKLVSLGFSNNLAGHGATVLRPISKKLGRQKKLK